MRVKLSYHLGAEISVAENIFFFCPGSKQKSLFLLMCQAQLYMEKSPPYNKEEFASMPRSKKIFYFKKKKQKKSKNQHPHKQTLFSVAFWTTINTAFNK